MQVHHPSNSRPEKFKNYLKIENLLGGAIIQH